MAFVFAADVPRISVIIPTLNEADRIETMVESLRESGVDEVLVVDGNSDDETVRLAQAAGAQVVGCSSRGRARQMNLGAKGATSEVLWFLHADTKVTAEAIAALRQIMDEREEVAGGGFARRFDSPSLLLRVSCALASLRGRFFGLFLGDQGLFVRKAVFEELGGFDESLAVGEDLDFSVRLRSLGKTVLLGPRIVSSARRFERHGPFRQTLSDGMMALKLVLESRRRMR